MTSNEERRDAARRKLEERLELERQAARKRKMTLIALSGVVVVVLAAIGGYMYYRHWDKERRADCTYTEAQDPFKDLPATLPADTPPEQRAQQQAILDSYKAGKAKERKSPMPSSDPLKEGTVDMTVQTSQGTIDATLNRADGACNVNAVVSLAEDGYYNGVPCHVMTSNPQGTAILCGDPTQTSAGNPGWNSPDEFPTDLKPFGKPNPMNPAEQAVTYPRGTIAVFNTNNLNQYEPTQNTGNAMLYIFVKDAHMPPDMTVIGKVDPSGLKVLDKVVDGGMELMPGRTVEPGQPIQTGKPKTDLTFKSVSISE